MQYTNKEFMLTGEYIDALNRNGEKRLIEWLPCCDEDGNADPVLENRIGKFVDFVMAESLLYRCRRDGIGPNEVQVIIRSGTVEV
jgi:hypothetical protein